MNKNFKKLPILQFPLFSAGWGEAGFDSERGEVGLPDCWPNLLGTCICLNLLGRAVGPGRCLGCRFPAWGHVTGLTQAEHLSSTCHVLGIGNTNMP